MHANLAALEAVLRDVEPQRPDLPNPRECLALIDQHAGSLGQPRDGNPDASWALYDGETIDFRRVLYDHQKTAAQLRALPVSLDTRRYFADRLAEGD